MHCIGMSTLPVGSITKYWSIGDSFLKVVYSCWYIWSHIQVVSFCVNSFRGLVISDKWGRNLLRYYIRPMRCYYNCRDIFWWWHFQNCLQLSRIHRRAIFCSHVSNEWHYMHSKLDFVSNYLTCCYSHLCNIVYSPVRFLSWSCTTSTNVSSKPIATKLSATPQHHVAL